MSVGQLVLRRRICVGVFVAAAIYMVAWAGVLLVGIWSDWSSRFEGQLVSTFFVGVFTLLFAVWWAAVAIGGIDTKIRRAKVLAAKNRSQPNE